MSTPRLDQRFVIGSVNTPAGIVPQISTALTRSDHWGSFKVRWDIHRMDYKVDPGLYAAGSPDDKSPVLVTANYKLTFDRLREVLSERSVWILVLETDGINVWCAAGKGTFGTEELIRRVDSSELAKILSHRDLILPQLSAPGVAAHLVKKCSGFKVIYGPILSKDLPAFLGNGLKAEPEMRIKRFTTKERMVLIPVELVATIKPGLLIMGGFFLLGGLGQPGPFWSNALSYGLIAALSFLIAVITGAVLTPLLLPWLPGRAFSLKGMIMGLITVGLLFALRWGGLVTWQGRLEMVGWLFLIPTITAYFAMNFTGASTYTSLSGVKKEMRWAVPMQISGAVVGLGLWFGSRFVV